MALLFNDFSTWQKHCADSGEALYQPVLTYEIKLKSCTEEFIWQNIERGYQVDAGSSKTWAHQRYDFPIRYGK